MSFLDTEYGKVTGEERDAFVSFELIPNNYETVAQIDEFKIAFHNGEKFYELCWKICDGEYNDRKVFQKIRCFSSDGHKRFRALNQLVLLFKICSVDYAFEDAPDDVTLMRFIGKRAKVKIRQWHQDGKSGNVVIEFYQYDDEAYKDVPF